MISATQGLPDVVLSENGRGWINRATDDQLRKAEAVAPMYPDALIAREIFHCTPADFALLMQADPRITEAITQGRSLAQMEWSKALLQQARAGNVDAIRYLEQTRYGVGI